VAIRRLLATAAGRSAGQGGQGRRECYLSTGPRPPISWRAVGRYVVSHEKGVLTSAHSALSCSVGHAGTPRSAVCQRPNKELATVPSSRCGEVFASTVFRGSAQMSQPPFPAFARPPALILAHQARHRMLGQSQFEGMQRRLGTQRLDLHGNDGPFRNPRSNHTLLGRWWPDRSFGRSPRFRCLLGGSSLGRNLARTRLPRLGRRRLTRDRYLPRHHPRRAINHFPDNLGRFGHPEYVLRALQYRALGSRRRSQGREHLLRQLACVRDRDLDRCGFGFDQDRWFIGGGF
jgi:hypothetical protein